jgi:hypothetical protein
VEDLKIFQSCITKVCFNINQYINKCYIIDGKNKYFLNTFTGECGRTQVRKDMIVEDWYKKERNETLKANHYRTNKYANPNSQLLVGLSVSRIDIGQ